MDQPQHLPKPKRKPSKKMEMLKKWKKSILKKCKSTNEMSCIKPNSLPKCHSYPSAAAAASNGDTKRKVAPGGCFTVYVGSERQRFVIKAKYASHPLFMMLLNDAKQQYGYCSEGPIILPCEVDFFYKVLAEMDSHTTDIIPSPGCGGYGSYALLSPSKLLKLNRI